MNIVVTGVKGQLGFDVVRELVSRRYENVMGIDIEDLDITKTDDVEKYFCNNIPKVIIHCAAYTAVDKAEDSVDLCMNVNVIGTRNLVEQAIKYQAKFVYISTDYVFDGEKQTPYETLDLPNPKSIYGLSKYLGEKEAMKHHLSAIVRISWVFGKNGNNFVKTMLRIGKERESINVVNDQFGSPTYTYDLSKFIVDLIESDNFGIFHATNEGTCTWYEFAKEIFKLSMMKTTVSPISSNEYITKAKRPKNSIMSKSKIDEIGLKRLPNWKDALYRYLKEIEEI